MIELYPNFEHLKKFNNIWIYSDPHFADPEMTYLRQNYIGDEEQVKRINSKVGKKDVIIILGDIGSTEFVKRIRGYKILIMGNHDQGKSNFERKVNEAEQFSSADLSEADATLMRKNGVAMLSDPMHAASYVAANEVIMKKYTKVVREDNHLFDEVYDGIVALNSKIILSHEPVNIPFMFNIHGHDHSNWEGANDELHLNVCAEHINYTPINLNTLLKQGKFKNVPSIHRITIDKATARKAKRNAGQ